MPGAANGMRMNSSPTEPVAPRFFSNVAVISYFGVVLPAGAPATSKRPEVTTAADKGS